MPIFIAALINTALVLGIFLIATEQWEFQTMILIGVIAYALDRLTKGNR